MLTENKTVLPTEYHVAGSTMDLGRVFSHVIANRWWVIVCLVVSTAAFSAMTFLTRPIYRATAVLTSAASDRGEGVASLGLASSALGGLASNLGIGVPRDAETQEALAVLRSRELTEAFITDKKLLPRLFPRSWNAATGLWKADEEPTLAKGFRYFDKQIRSIIEDRKTGLITMEINWTDRAEAAAWAIELVQRVNQEMRSRDISKADASLHFLEEELQSSSQIEVRNALAHLMETQIKKRMLAHVTQDYSFRFVDRPVATDGEKPIWPQRLLLLSLGPLAGLVLGIMLILLFRPLPREEP
jgi:uncharacterized protein involved in exopolysaccharide biosynthesis